MGKESTISLGFSLELRSHAISKAKVSFPLYYSMGGRQLWAPLRYGNGGIFYGSSRERERFLQNMRGPSKQARHCEVLHYMFRAEDSVADTRAFKSMRVIATLRELLVALLEARKELESMGGVGDLNKACQVLVLELGPQELVELKDPHTLKLALDLFMNSRNARLYPVMLTQLGEQVPPALLRILEFKAFLGPANEAFVGEKEPEKKHELYNVNRRLVGLLSVVESENLIPIHDLIYEASEYKIEKMRVAEAEEAAYREFLNNFPERG